MNHIRSHVKEKLVIDVEDMDTKALLVFRQRSSFFSEFFHSFKFSLSFDF